MARGVRSRRRAAWSRRGGSEFRGLLERQEAIGRPHFLINGLRTLRRGKAEKSRSANHSSLTPWCRHNAAMRASMPSRPRGGAHARASAFALMKRLRERKAAGLSNSKNARKAARGEAACGRQCRPRRGWGSRWRKPVARQWRRDTRLGPGPALRASALTIPALAIKPPRSARR